MFLNFFLVFILERRLNFFMKENEGDPTTSTVITKLSYINDTDTGICIYLDIENNNMYVENDINFYFSLFFLINALTTLPYNVYD